MQEKYEAFVHRERGSKLGEDQTMSNIMGEMGIDQTTANMVNHQDETGSRINSKLQWRYNSR